MDAGVPIKATCAGISIGRFSDDDNKRELFVTDIIGEEDFFGDMDFKVSGTREGITGIQLDLKIRGLNISQIQKVFHQARDARIKIIETMEQTIAKPRAEISPLAPRLITINIDPEKIGKLIGPGGKMIRGLQDKYGVTIDVEDDGTVMLAGPNAESINDCRTEIEFFYVATRWARSTSSGTWRPTSTSIRASSSRCCTRPAIRAARCC